MTTHELIQKEIDIHQSTVNLLKERLNEVKDEPEPKVCPHCGTNNLHYDATTNIWLCTFCGRVEF